jgi:hypothetical protein
VVVGEEESDVLYVGDPRVTEAVDAIVTGDSPIALQGFPLRIMPNLQAGRMLQQGARFTLHSPGSKALDPQTGRTFKAVVPSQLKSRIREQLREVGIDRGTLFPDLQNIIQELRYQAGLGLKI